LKIVTVWEDSATEKTTELTFFLTVAVQVFSSQEPPTGEKDPTRSAPVTSITTALHVPPLFVEEVSKSRSPTGGSVVVGGATVVVVVVVVVDPSHVTTTPEPERPEV
jgi:hypothetical protein